MSYASIADVRASTGFNDTSKVSDDYITKFLNYADGVINGKIGEVYQLPISSPPYLLSFLSLEIAIAALYMDQYGEEGDDKDKGWKKRLDFLTVQLEQIRLQKIKLFDDTTGIELARTTLRQPGYYPNGTSSDPNSEDSTAPKVSMNKTW